MVLLVVDIVIQKNHEIFQKNPLQKSSHGIKICQASLERKKEQSRNVKENMEHFRQNLEIPRKEKKKRRKKIQTENMMKKYVNSKHEGHLTCSICESKFSSADYLLAHGRSLHDLCL